MSSVPPLVPILSRRGGELPARLLRPAPRGGACVLACLIVIILTGPAFCMARRPPDPPYAPGELLVAFHETVSREEAEGIVRRAGARIGGAVGDKNLFLVLLPEGADVLEAAEAFSSFPEVRYAEPNYSAILLEKK